jgi:hypothetical protein
LEGIEMDIEKEVPVLCDSFDSTVIAENKCKELLPINSSNVDKNYRLGKILAGKGELEL